MSVKLLTEGFCPVRSVYQTELVPYHSFALKVFNLDLRLFENVFSKQRQGRNASERHSQNTGIVSCTKTEEKKQKESTELFPEKIKALRAVL